MKTKFLITITIYVFSPIIALASGLSASPSRLDFKLNNGEQTSKEIVVTNPTADVLIFEVYADEFETVITTNPESFTLESGARKVVLVTADAPSSFFSKKEMEGIISTNLSVVGQALAESKINVASGAKIPITVVLSPNNQKHFYAEYVWAGLLILIIGLFYLAKKLFKKQAA